MRRSLAAIGTGLLVLTTASLALAGKGGGKAAAKKKPPKAACGLDYLNLSDGASFTYAYFTPGDAPERKTIYVADPPSFTVKVLGTAKQADATVIQLEESYRKVVQKTELVCGKDGLTVSPFSFFFAGEPGGAIGMTLEGLTRTGVDYPNKTLAGETYAELKAKAVRTPSEGSGAVLAAASIELERKATVKGKEDVESKLGEHSGIRVEIQMTGRATLEGQPADKAFNMPGTQSILWFVPGTGLVRVETNQGKGWQLAMYDDGQGTVIGSPPSEAPVPVPGAKPAPATPTPATPAPATK